VLVTSRRRLAALEDSALISLDILAPGEATALLTRLAARAGIDAADPALSEITRLCGYLPLAIGLIAGQLKYHPARTAAQLAADLASAADRMALLQAENLSVAAAFDLSYQDLTEHLKRLFRRLGLIPGPTFDAYAASALDGTGLGDARRRLDELYDQHLVTEPAPGRYQLHDLLREYARALATTDDPADRDAAAGRVLDYYLHTALAAGRHFDPRASAYRHSPPGHPPAQAPDLPTYGQAVAWLDAERANLHAAADYAATSGRLRHAIVIPAAMSGFLAARGPWDQSAALHHNALAAARQAGDKLGEADTLGTLGGLQRDTGDYPAAATSLAQALALYRDAGDLPGQSHTLNPLGWLMTLTGDYAASVASHRQALVLARNAGDWRGQAWALNGLGLAQQLTGNYPAAVASQQPAPGPGTLPRHRAPSRPGPRAERPRPRAARNRRLSGRCRQPPAGPGTVRRPRPSARPGRSAEPPRRALAPHLGHRPGPRPAHPGTGHRPRHQRRPGGSTRPGRNRQQLSPRRQPQPGRRTPAAGTHDLPAHRRPRRQAHRRNPPAPPARQLAPAG